MNIEEALKQTLLGKKIKLPEWGGYWFREDGKVKVHTKDGHVLNTPDFSSYEHRTDWQTTEGALGFEFAIQAVKAGNNVKRKFWAQDLYLCMMPDNGIDQVHLIGLDYEMVWLPSQEDLFATDWERVAVL